MKHPRFVRVEGDVSLGRLGGGEGEAGEGVERETEVDWVYRLKYGA